MFFKKNKSNIFFAILLLIIINSFDIPICKLAGQKYPTYLFLSVRYFISLILLIPFAKFAVKTTGYSFISAALVYFLGNCSAYKSLRLGMTVSAHSFIESFIPYVSCLLAYILMKEKIKINYIFGFIISFLASVTMLCTKEAGFYSILTSAKVPIIFSLFSVFCYSLNNIVIKASANKIKANSYKSLLGIVFWNSFFGFIFNFIFFLIVEKNQYEYSLSITLSSFIIFGYFSIMMTLIYNYILYFVISNMKIQKFLSCISLYPILSYVIASCIFGETITIKLFLCFMASLLGMFFINSDYQITFNRARWKKS